MKNDLYNSKLDRADEIECEFTLTEVMQRQFADTFDMELDLLQGKIATLSDGTSQFKMKLSGYKAKMIIDFFRMIVSIPTDQIQVKINSLPLNKN